MRAYRLTALVSLLGFLTVSRSYSQTLYAPGGTVGTSADTNVTIGTGTSDGAKLRVVNTASGTVLRLTDLNNDEISFGEQGGGLNRFDIRLLHSATSTKELHFWGGNDQSGFKMGKFSANATLVKFNLDRLELAYPTQTLVASGSTFDFTPKAPSGAWARSFRFFSDTTPTSRAYLGTAGNSGAVTRSFWVMGDAGQTSAGESLTEGVHLLTNGNVGIGTTSPTTKLAVNGTIRAKEVIVETAGWADHVFAPGYPLPSLADTEAHIQEHGHLPGIPSAAEVAQNGVSVSELQIALLAKLEEMTLHQIKLEKRIAQLEADNQALSRKNPSP